MADELKVFTVNLKSLDQDIQDPIVAGAGDANGRTFRIIFDQEAEAQITPATKVYLSWYHKQKQVKGYNVFTKVSDDPIIWEIHWPRAMLSEGDALCCIELVDDCTLFQNAVIQMKCIADQMKDQKKKKKIEFEDMQLEFSEVKETAEEAKTIATEAKTKVDYLDDKIDNATFSANVLMTEI